MLYSQRKHLGGYFMRYSDFIKPQNKKVLALQERADKQAGLPSVKPGLSGNAGVGVGAVIPAKTAPDTDAHANAGAGLGIGLSNPAYLAGLLPDDFPFDRWEQLNTKQQVNALKYSGLTPQEQWVLLNTNIPFVELRSSSSASSGSINRIVNPNANVPRDKFAAGNAGNGLLYPSNTPNLAPLHNVDLIGKLKDTAASPATPSPASTPLPKPGPSPITTPNPLGKPSPYNGTAPMELTSRDKQMLLSILDLDTSLMSVTERKQIEFIERQVQRGVVTPNQLKQFYQDLISIRNKVEKQEWINKTKAESNPAATWGTELIDDQSLYSDKPSSFGAYGNLKDNGCGLVAMSNANQHLGLGIRFDDFISEMLDHRLLSTNFGGTLGMNPNMIALYNHLGADVTTYHSPNSIPVDHDAYIVLYFYPIGAHYFEAQYDEKNNCYVPYNTGVDKESAKLLDLTPSSYNQFEKDAKHPLTVILQWVVWGIDSPHNP